MLTSCVDVPQRNAEYRQNSFRARSEYNAFEDTTAIDATIVIVNYGGLDVESVTLTVSIVALHQYGDTSAQQAIQKENKGGTISTMDTI
ncbi:MAG: hypothetical protein LBK70_02265 [Clostridiales bacterium]|nr:hypothetical protein [Clostridiales bacterium]